MKRIRKLFHKITWVIASLLIILIILHLPPVQNLIKGFLEDVVNDKVYGKVVIERLRFKLWKGDVVVKNLKFDTKRFSARIPSIDLSFFSSGGLIIHVNNPHIFLGPKRKKLKTRSQNNKQSPAWMFLKKVNLLNVKNAHFQWGKNKGEEQGEINGSFSLLRHKVEVDAWSLSGEAAAILHGSKSIPLTLGAKLEIKVKELKISKIKIDSGKTSISANGNFSGSRPLKGLLSGTTTIDGSVMKLITKKIPGLGKTAGDFHLEFKDFGMNGDIALESEHLLKADSGPFRFKTSFSLGNRVMNIDSMKLDGLGGSFRLNGFLDIKAKVIKALIKGKFPANRFLTFAMGESGNLISSEISTQMDLFISGWKLNRLEGEVHLDPVSGKGLQLSGDINTKLKKKELNFNSQNLHFFDNRISIRGKFTPEKIAVKYKLHLPVKNIRPLLSNFKVSLPTIDAGGLLIASGDIIKKISKSISMKTRFETIGLKIKSKNFGVSGNIILKENVLKIKKMEITSTTGKIQIKGSIPVGDKGENLDLKANLKSFDLPHFSEKSGLQVSVDGTLALKGPVQYPLWNTEIIASLYKHKNLIDGRLLLRARGQGKSIVELDEFRMLLGDGTLTASGKYRDDKKTITGRIKGERLKLQNFLPLILSKNKLEGFLSIDADLSGHVTSPDFLLNLNLDKLFFNGSPLPKLNLEVKAVKGTAEIKGSADKQFLSGNCQLTGSYPMKVRLDLASTPFSALSKCFKDLNKLTLTSLIGDILLNIPLKNPRNIKYQVTIKKMACSYNKKDWILTTSSFIGDRESIRVNGLRLQGKEGALQLNGIIPISENREFNINLKGNADLDLLSLFVPNLKIEGKAQYNLRLEGPQGEPHPRGELIIADCRGKWGNLSWKNLELKSTGDKNNLVLNRLFIQLKNGILEAKGKVEWDDHNRGLIKFSLNDIQLDDLLPTGKTKKFPFARISADGELRIPVFSPSQLTGEGILTAIQTKLGDPSISLKSPMKWKIAKGMFSHSALNLVGKKTDLLISFGLNLKENPAQWYMKMNGNVNTSLANHFIDSRNLSLSGPLNIKAHISNHEGPLSGQIYLDGTKTNIKTQLFTVSQFRTNLILRNGVLEISDLKGKSSQGEIELNGRINPADKGVFPEADIQLKFKKVPVMLTNGTTSQISGDVSFSGDNKHYNLGGEIFIHQGTFRNEIDHEKAYSSRLQSQLLKLWRKSSLPDKVSLELKVDVQNFLVNNSKATLLIKGPLSIKGTMSMPEVYGNIHIEKGGEFKLGRSNIHLKKSQISLDGFPEKTPSITAKGVTVVSGTMINLDIEGNINNLHVDLSSTNKSELTQNDLAILLLTGRVSSKAGSQVGEILVEELSSFIGRFLQKKAGKKIYVNLSPDQSMFSKGTDPTTRFSLGTRVGSNLYLIYSSELNGSNDQTILDYNPPNLFRFRYISEEDGSHNIEIFHRLGFKLSKKKDPKNGKDSGHIKIDRISFDGIPILSRDQLYKAVKLKVGKVSNYWEISVGAKRIREKLYEYGYLSSKVDFYIKTLSSGKVKLAYFIDPGKKINLYFRGDKITSRIRKKIIFAGKGFIPEDDLPDLLSRQIKYSLQAKMFYQASVLTEVKKSESRIDIYFIVKKGLKWERLDLKFMGNKSFSNRFLAKLLPKSNTPHFFKALEDEVSNRNHFLRLHYISEGFVKVRIQKPHVEFDSAKKTMEVTIDIDEGTRVIIAEVNLPQELNKNPVLGLLLKAGRPFRLQDMINDRLLLVKYYHELGFKNARIEGILKLVNEKISISFKLEKGPLQRLGEIHLLSPGKVPLSFIRRHITLRTREIIIQDELARSRKRLLDTELFQSVDLRPVPLKDGSGVANLIIELVERHEIEVNYGLRYEIGDAPRITLQENEQYNRFEVGTRIEFINLLGLGYRFGLSGYTYGKQQYLNASFRSSFFLGMRIPTHVYFIREHRRGLDISGLEVKTDKITFQQYYGWGDNIQGVRWGDKMRLMWNYSFRHINLDFPGGAIPDQDTDRGSISLSLIGDNRDNFINPGNGFFWSVTSEFARKWLGSDVEYNKVYGQAYFYKPISNNILWAGGLRLGVVPGKNPALILEDRFKAGGPRSVRGYPINYLGPKNDLGEPLGGQAIAVFNMELRFPLFKKFHGGIFYDAGNVFALSKNFNLSNLRHSAGMGLRLMLPFGPIRLDWSFVLDPQPGENKSRLVFAFGHAF